MSAIDEYVAGMAARLAGPARAKADLIAEARDGLLDAAEAYTRRGMPAAEAAAHAVADFGAPDEVLPHYQQELAAAQGRRTAWLVAIALPVMQLLAPLMWWHSPWQGGPYPPSSGYLLLSAAVDCLGITAGIMAAITLLGLGWGSRLFAGRLPAAALLTRLTGVGVVTFVGGQALLGAALFGWSAVIWPAARTWPPMVLGGVAVTVLFTLVIRSAVRCLRVSGRALADLPVDRVRRAPARSSAG
jgi:hypothetical protein